MHHAFHRRADTLLIPTPNSSNHLFVVVTQKQVHTNSVIIVCFETAKSHPDRTVILNPGDHPFITHQTFVGYRHARIVSADDLIRYVEYGTAFPRDPCSIELLEKIREGVCRSKFTPNLVKEFYTQITWPI
jgi:hypothetical protein